MSQRWTSSQWLVARGRIVRFDDKGRQLGEHIADSHDAQACAATLKIALSAPRQRGLHRIRIILASPWAQCFVLPWRPLSHHKDWADYCRSTVGGQAGPTWLDGWRLSVDDAGWKRNRFVDAAPESLCQAIATTCRKRGLWLTDIQSLFVASINAHRRRITADDAACVVVDHDVLHIGFRHRANWSGFISLPGSVATLTTVLHDAAMVCALSVPEQSYVIGPASLAKAVNAPASQWLVSPWAVEGAAA